MKISVVTPSYQQGEFIERTIQSVITQDLDSHELEYVVMDGGSKDQTVSILEQYAHSLTFRSEPDRGQAHAVNKGICATSGEIIGWLNSDDIYYPGAIKKICDYFKAHPEVDVIYGDANFIDRNDSIIKKYPTEKWNVKRFQSCCFISQPSTFFRRKTVEKFGLLDESLHFCMDYEYWLRVALAGATIVYLPEIFSATRVYPETKTSSGYLKATQEALLMLQKKLSNLPAEWVVNAASANVRAMSGLNYPDIRFVMGVWLHLWRTTGQFKRGLPRFNLWCQAQWVMMTKFVRRSVLA